MLAVATLVFGLAVPLAGRDAERGLAARDAVAIAAAGASTPYRRVVLLVRDTARHIGNPHEDEARDDAETPQSAARALDLLARAHAQGVLGGLRGNVALAMRAAAARDRIVFVPLVPSEPQPHPSVTFAQQFRQRAGALPTPEAYEAYLTARDSLARLIRAMPSR